MEGREDERMGQQRMKKAPHSRCFKGFWRYGNFVCDEYTHTLRLKSELFDLRVGYANPSVCKFGNFAYGEYFCSRLL